MLNPISWFLSQLRVTLPRCRSSLAIRWRSRTPEPRRNKSLELHSAHEQSESERKGTWEPAKRSRWLVLSLGHSTHCPWLQAGSRWRRRSGVCRPRNGRVVTELAPGLGFSRNESRGHGTTRVQRATAPCTDPGGNPGHDTVACAPILSVVPRHTARAKVAIASALWACLRGSFHWGWLDS